MPSPLKIRRDAKAKPALASRVDTPEAALPLATLLSQVLVAFTIEFDNEAERRMPHWTTNHGSTNQPSTSRNPPTAGSATSGSVTDASAIGLDHGPWLVSMAMWLNCMQFVGAEGIRVGELEKRARTHTNLHGMERWGYIVVAPDSSDRRPKPPHRVWLIRATARGRMAQEVWRPLSGEIENRWRERFGNSEILKLREELWAVLRQIDLELPDCLPILGYGLLTRGAAREKRGETGKRAAADRVDDHGAHDSTLPALLAKVLLAFANEFEAESKLSLAISANILRVLDAQGARVREIPALAGVSKEAVAVALSFLSKRGYVAVQPEPSAARSKMALLTPLGVKARETYFELTVDIERRWQQRFGENPIQALREALERLVGGATADTSPLVGGLEPYPDGWRAKAPKPKTLPHFPMVLHRGGYPDGS
jgi:DNA-binding MarR family transcriptional regulator